MLLRTNYPVEDDSLLGKLGAIVFNKKGVSVEDGNLILEYQPFYGQFCQHPDLNEWALVIPDIDRRQVEVLLMNGSWEHSFVKNVQITCDWCGADVVSWWEGEDGTISCRPCLDKGAENRKNYEEDA